MENSESVTNNMKIILKGSVISLVSTMIILLIFSMVLTYTSMSESAIFPVIIVISFVCILIGSSLANFKIRKNGLFNGGIIGLIYIVSIYLISSMLTGDFSLNFNSIIIIILSVIAGLLGGIIGVNINLKFK